LESEVLEIRPAEILNLKQGISNEINAIPPAMLFREMEFILKRMYQCFSIDGYMSGVIFKKQICDNVPK